MPVLQLCFFAASDAYKESPRLPEASLKAIQGLTGCIRIINGIQNESEGRELAVFVIVWDSYPHSQEAQDSFTSSITGLLLSESTTITSHFIEISKDPLPCLSAPTTEFAVVSLKEGCSRDRLTELMAEQNASLDKAARAYPPCFCIPTIDDANVVLVIVGWDSREVHLETVSNEPFKTFIHGMSQLTDILMFHADLISY